MEESKTYHWCRIEHPERAFWGVAERVPWPIEAGTKPNPKVRYPAGDLREGVRRLRAEDGAEWNEQWAALEIFCDRGDELAELMARQELDVALRILDELEALRPGTGYCAFNRAFLLRSKGDLAGARAAIIAASERAPKVEWIWMRRGEIHEELKEDKDAIFCFRKALALLPRHAHALEGLCRRGVMCRMTFVELDGREQVSYLPPDEFRKKAAADIASYPADSPFLRNYLTQFPAPARVPQGELLLLTIDRILSSAPPDAAALRLQRADTLRILKRFDEANAILNASLRDDPGDAEALYVQAWCFFDQGKVDRGWRGIEETLAADPNHEKALKVKFGFGTNAKADTVECLTAWAEEKKSWRGYYLAAVQCSIERDSAACLRWAEVAYRLAPQERDALFIYANSLNNAQEGEHTAALIHPRLPALKGDFILKYVCAGAMKKLGLKDEAIRILREALAEGGFEAASEGRSDPTEDHRKMIQDFLDELTGLLARGDIDVEFFPRTHTLVRAIWVGTDEGPQSNFIDSGQPAPRQRDVLMNPHDPRQTTGSLTFYLHSETGKLDPISLGWFRVHELDYAAGPQPAFTLRITKNGKVEGLARQGERRLPVTWSLYRVPSMETEKPAQP